MQTGFVTANERVVPYDLGVTWEPNTSDPILLQHRHRALLVVDPHFDDEDQRLVVIRVQPCSGVWLGSPNDEGMSGHRLWSKGLSECLWAGEVLESEWVEGLKDVARAAGHPKYNPNSHDSLRHWILRFKESTAECIGDELSVLRSERGKLPVALL
jgi:hypothetical protein